MRRRRSVSRQRIRNHKRRHKTEKSSLEVKVEGWLTEQKIVFASQYAISLCHADLYIPRTNTVVEIHGCYWHSCEKCFPGPKQEHARQRHKDARRYTLFARLGYKILVLWEHEISNDFDAVAAKLRRAAGLF